MPDGKELMAPSQCDDGDADDASTGNASEFMGLQLVKSLQQRITNLEEDVLVPGVHRLLADRLNRMGERADALMLQITEERTQRQLDIVDLRVRLSALESRNEDGEPAVTVASSAAAKEAEAQVQRAVANIRKELEAAARSEVSQAIADIKAKLIEEKRAEESLASRRNPDSGPPSSCPVASPSSSPSLRSRGAPHPPEDDPERRALARPVPESRNFVRGQVLRLEVEAAKVRVDGAVGENSTPEVSKRGEASPTTVTRMMLPPAGSDAAVLKRLSDWVLSLDASIGNVRVAVSDLRADLQSAESSHRRGVEDLAQEQVVTKQHVRDLQARLGAISTELAKTEVRFQGWADDMQKRDTMQADLSYKANETWSGLRIERQERQEHAKTLTQKVDRGLARLDSGLQRILLKLDKSTAEPSEAPVHDAVVASAPLPDNAADLQAPVHPAVQQVPHAPGAPLPEQAGEPPSAQAGSQHLLPGVGGFIPAEIIEHEKPGPPAIDTHDGLNSDMFVKLPANMVSSPCFDEPVPEAVVMVAPPPDHVTEHPVSIHPALQTIVHAPEAPAPVHTTVDIVTPATQATAPLVLGPNAIVGQGHCCRQQSVPSVVGTPVVPPQGASISPQSRRNGSPILRSSTLTGLRAKVRTERMAQPNTSHSPSLSPQAMGAGTPLAVMSSVPVRPRSPMRNYGPRVVTAKVTGASDLASPDLRGEVQHDAASRLREESDARQARLQQQQLQHAPQVGSPPAVATIHQQAQPLHSPPAAASAFKSVSMRSSWPLNLPKGLGLTSLPP